MNNQENFLADKPINEEKDDKFQRYKFSKRIAETIISRNSSDSIVIGLYGAWGEGKTSVLNFIKEELKPHYPNIVQFSFNPWRFTDEASLLTSFFNALALELKKSFDANSLPHAEKKSIAKQALKSLNDRWNKRKGLIKTDRELVGDLLQQYGKYASIFSVGKAAVEIGKVISNVDIEELKERIEILLREQKKRIVIFIDDIDRLDKDEIHSIFRLVKLTGDFAYTSYILSFDENMVSSAIGERFGTGDKKAGSSFLEKIIQIPIKIPLAQKSALKNFCFNLVDKALDANQIVLDEKETRDFVSKFTSNIIRRLNTPRLAVRYGNTLSFSLPLLKGEVSNVDLLLIEAVRVFYPELYEFIRTEPGYFIGTFEVMHSSHTNTGKNEKFNTLFDECSKNYTVDEKADAKGILLALFPNVGQVWGTGRNWEHHSEEIRYDEKRISSSHYFNRYFSYTVIEGDISDVAFSDLIDFIKEGDYTSKIDRTISLIKSATPDNFIQKIRSKEKSYDSSTALNIVKVFSQIGNLLSKSGHLLMKFTTPLSQAAIFISQLVRNQIEEEKRYDIVQWLIKNAKPFEFAYEIFNFCRNDKSIPNKLFSDEQYQQLASYLIDRAKTMAGDKPIWNEYIYESKYMLNVWAHDFDKQDLNEYVRHHLNSNIYNIISLLRVFTPFIHSSVHPVPYYGDLDKNAYDWIKKVLEINFIYEKACELLGSTAANVNKYEFLDQNQTEENLLKQFIYWHNKEKN